MKDRDVLDALLIALFFLGYATLLAISRRVPRPTGWLDLNRLEFLRSQRATLIDQENMTAKLDMNADYGKAMQHAAD